MDVEPTATLLLWHMVFKVQEHLRSSQEIRLLILYLDVKSLILTISYLKKECNGSVKMNVTYLIHNLGFQELQGPLNYSATFSVSVSSLTSN